MQSEKLLSTPTKSPTFGITVSGEHRRDHSYFTDAAITSVPLSMCF